MLPKKNRVPRAFFEETLKKSLCLHTNYFSIRLHKKSLERVQFAVVVSKKVAKTAVKRNLLKRRFRSLLQALISKNPEIRGIVGIVFLKKEALSAKYSTLKEEIDRVIMGSQQQ